MTVKKTRTEIVDDIITYIDTNQPDVDTSVGDVVRDLSIDHIAKETSEVYEDLDHYRDLTSLENYADLTTTELDNLSVNFGLSRTSNIKATGTVTFDGSTTYIIDADTLVWTDELIDGSKVEFIIVNGITSNLTPPYTAVGDIEAVEAGIEGNVAAETIIKIPLALAQDGISTVINLQDTSGGVDIETNESLATRCLDVTSQSDVGTAPGYERIMLDITGVDAVAVAGPNDIEMERNVYGSAVDVWIKGSVLDGFSQISSYDNRGYIRLNIIDSDGAYHLPAESVMSVVGLVGGTIFTTSQYRFDQDTDSIFSYSQKSTDKVTFTGSMVPLEREGVAIEGTFNSLIKTCQQTLDSDTNRLLATDALARGATSTNIVIACTISVYPGYTSSDVATTVQITLVSYINNLTLGDDIEEADLVTVILDASEGVSAVTEPFTDLRKSTDESGTSGSVTILKNEYPQTTSANVTVSTT